jgi:bifunctional DNA-binding transcriptional regulator/antitoxin component of YhaV-PrlF toxin-antitoxin module
MPVARVQSRGQVTIPREIREACGINDGTDLYFVQTSATGFECQILPSRRPLREVVDQYTVDGIAPALDELREEMGAEMLRDAVGLRVEEPASAT